MRSGAIVLAGGLSSRMGRAKALLPWHDCALVVQVVDTLRSVVEPIVVVTSAELELAGIGLEERGAVVVRDRAPRLGPLGGIREGLTHLDADLAYVTSADAPFLTSRLVESMLSFGGAAAPVIDDFVQSISAVYPTALASTADELIAAGRMRPLFLLEAADYRRVLADELPDVAALRSFNTPEDYLAALADTGQSRPVVVELLGLARSRAGVPELEAPCGSLGSVLRAVEERVPELTVLNDNQLAGNHLLSLNGRQFLRDLAVPLGPGDHLIITDAAVGG